MMTRLGVVFLAAACAAAFGGTVVVPNITTPGNQPVTLGANPQRIQEIVGSGQFPGPLVITGIRLRAAPGTGRVGVTYPSFKITVSSTQAFPNTLNGHTLPSVTYANNVGPDATTVYNGALTGSSPGCTGPDPCPFDISIPFTVPFPYDNTKARLLVDMVVSAPSGTPTGKLDGISFPDSNSSTVAIVGGDPTQPTGRLSLAGFVLGLDTTTPLVTAISNSASNIVPGLPNAGIAQGSIFIVKGSSLGPSTLTIAPAAFQSTNLNGTSVAVTVGQTTVNALMYYTSNGQLAALLPSNTPTGIGTLTVSYNGQTSAMADVTIVPSNLGVFTIDSSGQGPGIVTYPDYSLVSAAKSTNCGGPSTTCGAANPGDTLILWATGLGPVSGADASGAGLGQNMPNIPLTVWLGGVKAQVIYQGRSGCCVGEDQIAFVVPANVPTGCAVPLVVQINNQISNYTVMPVANGSRNCTPVNPALASVDIEQAVTAGPITFGSIELRHDLNGILPPVFNDHVNSMFGRIRSYNQGTQPFLASWLDDQPPGTCAVFNNLNNGGPNPPISDIAGLDAGSSFTVKGPNGSMSVKGNPGSFDATLSTTGMFLVPGAYTVTGSGGADIGPFNAATTFPASPIPTSPANNATATRSNGMTVTWSGGDPNGNVRIIVTGATDNTFSTGAQAFCVAPASSGTFTIPPYVLLALPASNFGGFVLAPADTTVPFTATGLSVGLLTTHNDGTGFGYGAGTGGFGLK